MSGSATTPQHSYNIPGATTEFSQYLAHEKAKTIPVNNYDLNNSLRVWFLEFEQQALVHGIDDLNICSFHLTKYMPLVIQRWIPTLPVTVRKIFSLLKEALLNRFGMDAEDENRLLLKQLKQCKQLPRESIRLHAAKWEHLLSLITDKFSAQTKISFFIQSLEQRDTRLTLTSLVAALNINTVDDVIQQAINLEVRAKLLDVPETVETNSDVVPMEIDYINRHNNKQYSSKKKQFNNYNNHNNKLKGHGNAHQQQSEKAPRLYDRHGNPVCGYCFQQHRTIDCSQHQGKRRFAKNSKKYNVHTVDTISVTQEGVVNLDAPMRVVNSDTIVAQPSINHVNYQHTNTPISYLSIGKTKIQILWDTGSAITCIAKSVTDKLKLPIDKSQIILYTDVNRNANKTHGVIKLDVFNTTLKLHVIDELARDVIIGYDTMRLWKAMIDTTGQVISLSIQNVQHVVKFLVNPNLDVSNTANSVCYTSIQPQIDKLLVKYNSIIPADNDKPSTTDLVEFTIDTGDSPPVYSAPRVYHPDIQKKIDEKLEKLVKNGIVSKVTFSEWGSNVSAVPKPDGDIRPCGNYVKLNSITQTIKYPFVHIHHALQSLGKSIIFSKIDLASGYYAIKIAEEDKKKTALVTTNGTYIFNFMPFGLKNAPAVFQSLMDRVLGPLKYTTAIAYLDDVIIHSSSVEQHIIDLENVLRRIQSANLSINRKKCAFGMKSIEFLGFIVSDRGISANPDKIKAIQVLPAPTSLKEIEQFLGVCGVYQKFISNYQVIAEPLRRFKKKDVEFVWSEEQQQAFETLKDRLATLPTLVQPDFKRPFELLCDAATTSGIGVILCQRDDDGAIYPISFSSRSISKFEQKYSIRELEALSIVWGITKIVSIWNQGIFWSILIIVLYNGSSPLIKTNNLVYGDGVSSCRHIHLR